jgi:phthiocerol/phenolphthiocerol synthesis type-I polyketide synthase C
VRPGSWDGCDFRPLTRRAPAAGEVELAVEASALNFVDVMKVMGTYPDRRGGALLGTECVGVVTRVGPGVEAVAVGDRLVACTVPTIATHVTLRQAHTRPAPARLSVIDAVTLPTVLATVWFSLVDVARVRAGETVLIHSAAGGVGLAAVQVARLLGAEILATAGSERKRRYLRELGVEHVFDSRSLDWVQQVRDVTGGRGVDVVLNSLTGAAIAAGLEVLAERGRFVEVGKKDIYGGRMVSLSAFRKGISMTSVDLASLTTDEPDRFARVLADSWARVETGEITPLPAMAFPLADAGEAVREMSRGTHIGKFVLDHRRAEPAVAPEARPEGRYRSAGTYLISGGLGALGFSLAEHLAGEGAGALLLLGRRSPDKAATARVERLRSRGVEVRTLAVDVANRDALAAALDGVRSAVPPLRGVFHAAGLLDDATIGTVTDEQVARVLAPKTAGAVNLDAVTADDPLDLFVLFSSAAGLVGNTGQAAYAAANSFLDGFARERRAGGRPALSVQWGPFADIGLAAVDTNRGARLADRGMRGFDAASAWAELDRLHDADGAVAAFMPLDLRQWFDSYPDTAALHSWSVLRAAAENGTAPLEGNDFVAGLLAADDERRQAAVEARIRELVTQVLRLNGTDVAGSTPFKSLGLDSLMSLELRNRLEAAFARKLSPTLLWTYGTVDTLTGALAELVTSDGVQVATDGR